MLTVETEVNGDSKRTNEIVFLLLDRWACRAGTRDLCTAFLAALVCPVQNIFLLFPRRSLSFVPIAQQAGQAAVLGRLSLNGLCP
jgi:hypothetical protein